MSESDTETMNRSAVASKGGIARAESLSKDRQSEIGRTAAMARWSTDVPKAIAEGFVNIAGRTIACAVLITKLRVLTQETFLNAIGRAGKAKGGKGSRRLAGDVDGLPPFLAAENLERFITDDLRRAATPIVFRTRRNVIAYGYDANLLRQVCEVYRRARDAHFESLQDYQRRTSAGETGVEFRGVLLPKQEHIVRACDALLGDLATDGIIAMVDRATGFMEQEVRDEIEKILRLYIAPQLLPWAERFSDEFFKQVYRLYGWMYTPGSAKRPQCIGNFINKYIYGQLPPGVLEEIQSRNPVLETGHRKTQNHRLLTTHTGIPHLDKQVTSTTTVLALTDAGAGTKAFEELFYRVHPRLLPPPKKSKKSLPPPVDSKMEQGNLFPPELYPTIER